MNGLLPDRPEHNRTPPITDPLSYSGLALKTSDIVGTRVVNLAQEDMGHVEDVVIDQFNGRVVYLVVGVGGVLGLGEKRYAVPWKAVHYDRALEAYVLNVSRQEVENAPGFDNEGWLPADPAFARRVQDFYNVPPYWGV